MQAISGLDFKILPVTWKKTYGCQEGMFGMDMYILLYLKWIANRDLLYSTLLNVMCRPGWEGVWGRMDTRICMAESLRCSLETITLLISYTPVQNVFDVKKKLKLEKKCIFLILNS